MITNTIMYYCFIIFLFLFLGSIFISSSKIMVFGFDHHHQIIINPLVELSSREDLAQLAGYGDEKLSTVLVSGTVLCESSLDAKTDQLHSHRPVSGASMAVSCHSTGKIRKSNWVRGTTDEYGDFLIDLPSHLHAIPSLEKVCLVKVLQLPKNSPCSPAFTGKHKGIKLSTIGSGIRTYTADTIHLTPKPSQECKNALDRKKKMFNAY